MKFFFNHDLVSINFGFVLDSYHWVCACEAFKRLNIINVYDEFTMGLKIDSISAEFHNQ